MKIKSLGLGLVASLVLLSACQQNTGEQKVTEQTQEVSSSSSTASSSEVKASNEEFYASVLDLYRPVVVDKTMPDVSGQDNEVALSLNMVYDAVANNQNMTYAFVDINQDKQDELLIGDAEHLYAIYYLKDGKEPSIVKGAGVAGRGGARALLQVYEDGTIYYTSFQAMRPEAQASTYQISDGQLKELQTVDYSLAETRDATGLVGLADAKQMDLSQANWQSFDAVSEAAAKTEASTGSSKTAQSKMAITAIQAGDFSSIAGTWKNGKGYVLTFDQNGLVSDTDEISLTYAKVEDGFLKASLDPITSKVGGAAIAFLPQGVAITEAVTSSSPTNDFVDPSDQSKDRIWVGQGLPGSDNSSFYYKVK